MLTAEPTSGVVWNANRGAITLRVRVRGKSAHVGLQHLGANAFERMLRVVERLQGLKREVESRATTHNIGAERELARGAAQGASATARKSILMLGGQSGGGTNFDVVPEECWFTVDRRINPEEDFDAEKERLLGVLEECKRDGTRLEWEILQEAMGSLPRGRKTWTSAGRERRGRRARRRGLRCVRACWKFDFMPRWESPRMRTVRGCSR